MVEMNYCRRCGKNLETIKDYYSCPDGHNFFQTPAPCVGVFFVDNDGKYLFSRRAIEPGTGMLDTIGGFVEPQESFEAAAVREIREETGLERAEYGKLTYLCSRPGTYEYQGEGRPVLSVFFVTQLEKDVFLQANDDVAEIVTLALDDIDTDEFYGKDVQAAITFLKEEASV